MQCTDKSRDGMHLFVPAEIRTAMAKPCMEMSIFNIKKRGKCVRIKIVFTQEPDLKLTCDIQNKYEPAVV